MSDLITNGGIYYIGDRHYHSRCVGDYRHRNFTLLLSHSVAVFIKQCSRNKQVSSLEIKMK